MTTLGEVDAATMMQLQMKQQQQQMAAMAAAAAAGPVGHVPVGNVNVGGSGSKKPRGKMTPYACFVKVIRAEHKKKHPNEHIVFAEFSKKCAEKWSQMNDKEKKRFQEMSLKDKERYEREMADYEPPAGEVNNKTKKKKRTKDPNAPKRALSAFMWFCKDARKEVKEVSPELRMGEIAKVLSVKWKECANREYYDKCAEDDKKRYAEAMKIYKSQKAGKPINMIQPTSVPVGATMPQLQKPMESESESDESGSEEDEA